MQLKHLQTVIPPQDGPAKIMAMCWSPNNMKLAVCNADRVVLLFDEKGERKDKFPTKPADSKNGRKSYVVNGLAFSPDSTKLAVGQSDNIIYVYKLGDDWGEKKSICNKFLQTSCVTCLVWLTEGPIVYGQTDGKVRAAHTKANKAQTLYTTNSLVVSIAPNTRGTGFLSGHADGTIVRYYVADDTSMEQQGRIVVHSSVPYALAWLGGWMIAGGCDRRVTVYDRDGRIHRHFDYPQEKEFTVAAASPAGQAVAIASYNRVRLYGWSPGKAVWEEIGSKEIENLYTVTCLAWKRDGSSLALSSLTGSIEILQTVLKRTVWKKKFEITYVGASQVLVKPMGREGRGVLLRSQSGYEIDDVRILGQDRYLIARTPHTLLLGDLERNLLSEVPWPECGRQEKFYLENPNVCLIFNAGELTLVEYGNNDILGSVRTEFMNPHLISVRLNERKQLNSSEDNKKLAYLLDRKTICIVDLVYGVPALQANHDSKIDWLELNETSHKLLFRDKKMSLTLLDTRTGHKNHILSYCTFVQWVTGSDVVVAQSHNNACVWYNIDTPDRVSTFPVRGDIIDVIRHDNKTEVLTQEGNQQLGYQLDEGLVEFGTAIHDSDFGRAVLFLEGLEAKGSPDTEAMWQNLADIVLGMHYFNLAHRCYAALGDMPKTYYLSETLKIAQEYAKANGGDGMDCPEVWARMAILNKQLKSAEAIYLEQNQLDKALEMYKKLYKWDDALELAEASGYRYKNELKKDYASWLMGTGQFEKAGHLKEEDGNYDQALSIYLEEGLSSQAARIVLNRQELLEQENIVRRVVNSLEQAGLHQLAGQLFEATGSPRKAVESYRKANAFSTALHLARQSLPQEVLTLEEEWGDHLSMYNQLDSAINHYIEAGKTIKALEAAIGARQWKKAVQIVNVINDVDQLGSYYAQLGQHFSSVRDLTTAEKLFVKAGLFEDAVKMYLEVGEWEKAREVGDGNIEESVLSEMLLKEGASQESLGDYQAAETLYVLAGDPDKAIAMHKGLAHYQQMMKLVEEYHPELVSTTHLALAQQLESSGNTAAAEGHYVSAGEWKLAVKMLRAANMWEQAHKVAKDNGGERAGEQVAYLWAKSLSTESAVKLLTKLGLLEQCIDYACDSYQFEFGFELSQSGLKSKLPDVHYKYAMTLEDDGKFKQAEEHFVKADKPKEAVLMYIHSKEWENAERVAEASGDEGSIQQVLLAQAKHEFTNNNYAKFESLLLRAQKPDIIVHQYQECGMWMEALKVCREYLPSKLAVVEADYEREVGSRAFKDAGAIFSEASQWEQNGQYLSAVNAYLKVNQNNCSHPEVILKALKEAERITNMYLSNEEALQVARVLGDRLVEIGEHSIAAQLWLSLDMVKEAIDVLIAAEDWTKARKIAQQLEPRLESYVEGLYKESLSSISDVDITAKLDAMCQQGQFTRVLDMAKPYGVNIFNKYLAVYATHLIKSGLSLQALEVFREYGAPAIPQNSNIYRKIALDILATPRSQADYSLWALLRDMFHQLVEELSRVRDEQIYNEFSQIVEVTHYLAVRSVCASIPNLIAIAAKISIALLRYSHIIPADKAYFEAGMDAKEMGRTSEGFVFLNHCLDIVEALEEGSTVIDYSDLSSTDFPRDVLQQGKQSRDSPSLTAQQLDDVRQWVLAVSMDQNIDMSLPVDSRGLYGSSLGDCPPCIVSGWPVLTLPSRRPNVTFSPSNRQANSHDWTSLNMALRMEPGNSNLADIFTFITKWAGSAPNFSLI